MMIRNWSEIPDRPLLPVGECQLWLAWLDEEDPESFRGLLSEDEHLRAGRLRSPLKREPVYCCARDSAYLVGSILVTQARTNWFSRMVHKENLSWQEICNRDCRSISPIPAVWQFSVSHLGLMLAWTSKKSIRSSDLEATASIFLSPDELAEFEASPADGKLERFFTMWTCKEAILKARGTGFSGLDKNILVKSFSPHHSGREKNAILQNERLTSFIPAEGFKGALVCL